MLFYLFQACRMHIDNHSRRLPLHMPREPNLPCINEIPPFISLITVRI